MFVPHRGADRDRAMGELEAAQGDRRDNRRRIDKAARELEERNRLAATLRGTVDAVRR